MDILSVLQSKNRCLRRLLSFSRDFLEKARASGVNEALPEFQAKRDAALRALELYDTKVSELIRALPEDERSPVLIGSIRALLADKALLAQEIIDLDAQVIELIESEKARIQREISSSQKSAETIRKFKSAWVTESGEGFDSKL